LPQRLLRGLELGLAHLLLGDVAPYGVEVLALRHGGPGDPDHASVSAEQPVFETARLLSRLQSRHHLRRRRAIIRVDDLDEGTREQFGFAAAEQARPGRVDRLEAAVEPRDREQIV
jgi:hypothetical protein